MKVSELVEALKGLPPNAEVWCHVDQWNCWAEVGGVHEMTPERKAKMADGGADCDWAWFEDESELRVVRITANVGFNGYDGE